MSYKIVYDYLNCNPGTLDEYTQSFVYNKFRDARININNEEVLIPDYIGFIDKDVEQLIMQGVVTK